MHSSLNYDSNKLYEYLSQMSDLNVLNFDDKEQNYKLLTFRDLILEL